MNRTAPAALFLAAALSAPFAAADKPFVSAALSVDASMAQLEFVRGEPVLLEGTIANAGAGPFIIDDYGPYAENGVRAHVREAESGRLLDPRPDTPASLVPELSLPAGQTKFFSVDLRQACDLSRTGRYHADVFVNRGLETAVSRVLSFSIVEGVEIGYTMRALSSDPRRPLRFALLYMDRNKRQELFLRVTDPSQASRIVSFVSLGSLVRVAEPTISFGPNDLVTVVQQISRDRYARTRIDFSGGTARVVDRDDSFVSLASIREDANARVLMSRIAEAESARSDPPKERRGGVFGGRQTTRTESTPEQKNYSGTVIRPGDGGNR